MEMEMEISINFSCSLVGWLESDVGNGKCTGIKILQVFRAAKVMTFSITGDSDDRIGRDLSGVDLFVEELVDRKSVV